MTKQNRARNLYTPAGLSVLYVLTVLLHLQLLAGVWVAPYIAHDEVQYCMVGENLRAGRGFTIRGAFASTVPPLFPLFVAAGHSVQPQPRQALFVLSVLAICTLIFPVYRIARELGLPRLLSMSAALAGTFLPSTFYAGMYMSEILQLPLFFLAFWLSLRWLRKPGVTVGAVLGLVFGIMALNRFATLTYLVCFLVAAFIALQLPPFYKIRPRSLLSLAIVIVSYSICQGGWWAYKAAHGASVLGAYGRTPASWGLPPVSLLLAYLTDALLAAGLIVAAPFCVGWRRLYRDYAPTAVLVAITMAVLVITTAISDGTQTGFLRERYFIYCFPLIMIVALRGAGEYFDTVPRWLGAVTLISLPAVCLFGVLLYDFHVTPLIESSWAHAVGTLSLSGATGFSRERLLGNGLILITVAGICLIIGRKHITAVLAAYLMLFHGYALARVGRDIAGVTASIHRMASSMLDIFPNGTQPLEKVVIAGLPPGWDEQSVPQTPRFLNANTTGGLTNDAIWYMEALRLLDVRMCGSPYCVYGPYPGAYFLTTVVFPNLRLVNQQGSLRLYRMPSAQSAKPLAVAPIHLPATDFKNTDLTEPTPGGTISGKGSGQSGVLVFGPYRKFAQGLYSVKLLFDSATPSPLRFEVASFSKVLEFEDAPAARLAPMWFVPNPSDPIEFRISGPDSRDFVFKGADVRSEASEGSLSSVEYGQHFAATDFLTRIGERLADGSYTSHGRFGFLCYGPYRPLPAGKYKLMFKLSSPANAVVRGDVAAEGKILAAAESSAANFPALEFTSDGKTPLEFRIVTPAGAEVVFSGATVLSLE